MVNNTIAYIKGNDPDASKIHFHYKQTMKMENPKQFLFPQTSTSEKPQFFWLGDGFVNKEKNNTLYIFGYKVERTGAGVFDFIEPGVSIIAVKMRANHRLTITGKLKHHCILKIKHWVKEIWAQVFW